LVPFLELAIAEKTGNPVASTSTEQNLANMQKLFPRGIPKNTDIVDLAVRINAEKGSGKAQNAIARELTGEMPKKCPKAKSLLSQIRRLAREKRLNL
jgi:hypothetical protein